MNHVLDLANGNSGGGDSESPDEISLLTGSDGIPELGLTKEFLDTYEADLLAMADVVDESRTSQETEQMALHDTNRNNLAIYIITRISRAGTLPLEAERDAGKYLYKVIKPYNGIARLPMAQEIIRRGITVVWWGNIRFEKSYTEELCDLLQRSGCIAVSGGLEVASPRLLKLINKGVTVAQVARVANNFTGAGIMVHAYLMYGFPTQTAQETIDSLETVRQMFELGLIQSGFWHRFAMTAHSPVGLHPAEYSCRVTEPPFGGFARNDVQFEALSGCDPELFSEGLRVSLYNYMNGTGFDLPLHKWFGGMKVPRTTLPPNYIERIVEE